MTPVFKRCFAILTCLALTLTLAAGARGDEAAAGTEAPVATSQNAGAQSPQAPVHPSHEQMAKEMEDEPCQSMPMGKMGMGGMGNPKPGAPGMGMMGGGMGEMGMMGAPGMGMPGMPGMPMMHERMMMRMMARNPKLAGKMLQMRADVMRAIADVLTKYGKEMESGQWPAAQGKGGDGD
jgi:hypothetical protein